MLKQFDEYIDKSPSTGCWHWTRTLNPKGYGMFRGNRAHRIAYESMKGQIPIGMQIDHLCRVRHCVNPDHLEAVTPYENNSRGQSFSAINLRKTHCLRGHPFDPENTYKKELERVCKKCRAYHQHRYHRKCRANGLMRIRLNGKRVWVKKTDFKRI